MKPLSHMPFQSGTGRRWLQSLALLCVSAFLGYAQQGTEPDQAIELPTNGLVETHDALMNGEEPDLLNDTNAAPGIPISAPSNVTMQIQPFPGMNRFPSTNSGSLPGFPNSTNLAIPPAEHAQDQEESASRREFMERLRNSARTNQETPASSGGADYGSFRIITDRNIFNQNRSPGRSQVVRREEPERRRTESFSLVGTMSYEKGVYAFFDGTSSDYQKTVKPDEEIAGYKVKEINYNCVKLISSATNATNQLELPVGMQLTREDMGEWRLGPQTASYSGSSRGGYSSSSTGSSSGRGFDWQRDRSRGSDRGRGSERWPQSSGNSRSPGVFTSSSPAQSAPSTTPSNSSTPETGAGGDASEVLKMLMQRREQELNK